jgi:PemK-like, MazF-like toxin of type II toxin-antitoxin system
MGITSNLKERINSVTIDHNDMRTGELKIKSIARIDKIYSLNKNLIIKTFGKLNIERFSEIIDKLILFLKTNN